MIKKGPSTPQRTPPKNQNLTYSGKHQRHHSFYTPKETKTNNDIVNRTLNHSPSQENSQISATSGDPEARIATTSSIHKPIVSQCLPSSEIMKRMISRKGSNESLTNQSHRSKIERPVYRPSTSKNHYLSIFSKLS